MLNTATDNRIDASKLKAMGNPFRIQIINLLQDGEKCVSTLNASVKVSQPALSQHLSKLRRSGILGARREQRQIYYYINDPHVLRICGVLHDMRAPHTKTAA